MNEASYTAWNDKLYEWPPPDGWYQADDGKWWPDGYGPTGDDRPDDTLPGAGGIGAEVSEELLFEVERTSIFPAGGSGLADAGANVDRLAAESQRPVYDELPSIDDVFGGVDPFAEDDIGEEESAHGELLPVDDDDLGTHNGADEDVADEVDELDGYDAGNGHDYADEADDLQEEVDHRDGVDHNDDVYNSEHQLDVDLGDHDEDVESHDHDLDGHDREELDHDRNDHDVEGDERDVDEHAYDVVGDEVEELVDDHHVGHSAMEQPAEDHLIEDPAVDDERMADAGATMVSSVQLGELPDGYGEARAEDLDDDDAFDPEVQPSVDGGDPPSAPGRGWLIFVAGLAVALVIAGIASFLLLDDDAPAEGLDLDEITAATGPGSFNEPYSPDVGVVVLFEDETSGEQRAWVIEVVEQASDITEQLVAEQGASAPAESNVLAVTRLKVTYQSGPVPGDAGVLELNALGDSLRLFEADATCSTIDDQLVLGSTFEIGDEVVGNLCWEIPGGDLAGLKLAIEAAPVQGVVFLGLNQN